MSAPEPTAEHVRLAREALPVNATPGQVNRIARALAAAEARGFERGRASEDARADRSCRCDQSDGPCACRRQRKEPR